MNGRDGGPLSPISAGGGSEWSGISKYQTLDTDSPYSPNNRGQLASPPISAGSNSTMNGSGFSRGPDANSPSNGPSPPSSIARSSNEASLYNGTTLNGASDNGRSRKDDQFEASLSEHYVALKRYLASSLRDEKDNPRLNKARDKLLRLSPVQFQELSTDVFDELQRRQAAARRGPNDGPGGPPPYLLPKDAFHPKRNQARQKLSTLPPPRFRDLATDVFYELERRFPRFAGGDISRTDSPASMRGPPSRIGTPVEGPTPYRPGSRGGPRIRRPSETSVMSSVSAISGYPRSDSRNGSRTMNMNGMPSPGLPPNDYGRPQPKTFQSNTIVPNKSTMVEDDDDPTGGEDNDDEDAFGLESAARSRDSKKSSGERSEADKKLIESYEAQVAELREKLGTTEDSLRQKSEELASALDEERSKASKLNLEKKELSDLGLRLENQLADAQRLNESLQSELDRVRSEHSNLERELRAQIDEQRTSSNNGRGVGGSELERENEELRNELREQQEIADEVRREAQEFLREMRMLSERSGSSFEREEQLTNQVNKLEEEVKDWRNRYARTKTQLRSLRASSIGLTIQQDAAKYARESGFTGEDGLVKDVHVTKFQISIDELLRTARTEEPERVMDYMKSVVVNVMRITKDIDESSSNNGDLAKEQSKLKARVSVTANNLITASKNFASAKGLSPISLLDAAASHLTTAVVELVRTVKIRPTPAGDLEDDDDGVLPPVDTTGFFPRRDGTPEKQAPPYLGLRNDRASAISSVYSSAGSPRASTATRPRSSSAKDTWASRRPLSRNGQMANGVNGMNGSKNLAPGPIGFGIRTQESDVGDLKVRFFFS